LSWSALGVEPAVAETPVVETPAVEPPPAEKSDDDTVIVRDSEALQDKLADWTGSGFRLWLGFGYGFAAPLEGSPAMQSGYASVGAGWRFTEWLGLMAVFTYGVTREGFNGMRWSGTLEPVLYLGTNFALSVGFGFAGLQGGRADVSADYPYSAYIDDPDRIELETTDAPEVPPPFPSCDGDGMTAVLRASYLFTVGDLFSTGPMITLDGQWTYCADQQFYVRVPVEERDLVPHQWWGQFDAALSWVAAWR